MVLKRLLIIVATFTVATSVQAQDVRFAEEWYQKGLSDNDRDRLVAEAKAASFSDVAGFLVRVLAEPPFPAVGYLQAKDPERPWRAARLTAPLKREQMASAVWRHHMETATDAEKARILLSVLKAKNKQHERIYVVYRLYYSWSNEVESELLRLTTNREESLDTRKAAAESLLRNRPDLNPHIGVAMDVIRAHAEGFPRCRAFNHVTNHGNRLFSLSEENRAAVVEVGFDALSQLAEKDLRHGYFVAVRLGYILKIPNEFKPDQDDPKYQEPTRLSDKFFHDTTRNALAWHDHQRPQGTRK